jgi:hypothetical protein
MPWEWDWDNYSGENADMVGFFYPEDIANILSIMKLDAQSQKFTK